MTNRITLITPPDIFENSNDSILLVGMSDNDQMAVSKWLSDRESIPATNLYVYQNELDIGWLFHAANRSAYIYINLDGFTSAAAILSSYLVSKNGVYWLTENPNVAAVLTHISHNRVAKIEDFLEFAFDLDK